MILMIEILGSHLKAENIKGLFFLIFLFKRIAFNWDVLLFIAHCLKLYRIFVEVFLSYFTIQSKSE